MSVRILVGQADDETALEEETTIGHLRLEIESAGVQLAGIDDELWAACKSPIPVEIGPYTVRAAPCSHPRDRRSGSIGTQEDGDGGWLRLRNCLDCRSTVSEQIVSDS